MIVYLLGIIGMFWTMILHVPRTCIYGYLWPLRLIRSLTLNKVYCAYALRMAGESKCHNNVAILACLQCKVADVLKVKS